jgi:YVTN family beta-propeller protein
MIGAYLVNVGSSPTAVATFKGANVVQNSSDDCDTYRDTYTGQTQGLVANSGSNTVTQLDLVNDAVIGNITVGNQPVAIVVSSDGSNAYVANYTDSTVTRIALTSGNAITTVAVGGQPTSVALTSGGVLWVGGNGFLTEINTQNMSVTATVPASGKSILALGYSDGVGQLVATSVELQRECVLRPDQSFDSYARWVLLTAAIHIPGRPWNSSEQANKHRDSSLHRHFGEYVDA